MFKVNKKFEKFLSWLGSCIITFGNISTDTSLIIEMIDLMETLSNVSICDTSHDKNLPIKPVSQNIFKVIENLVNQNLLTQFDVSLQFKF